MTPKKRLKTHKNTEKGQGRVRILLLKQIHIQITGNSFSKAKLIITNNQNTISCKYGTERDLVATYILKGTVKTKICYVGNINL